MKKDKQRITAFTKAKQTLRDAGGMMRTSDAIRAGIHPRTLYALRDSGFLVQISRGLYRLSEMESISDPDLVVVSSRAPNAVICLISALSFHEITTQIPHEVSAAIPRYSNPPAIVYPPTHFYKFSPSSYQAGIEEHLVGNVTIKVYSAEKTLVDCFKFRNKIGMDIVLEALKLYRNRMQFKHAEILEYAKICRVEKIMYPYLEAHL
jgi:predicted transcriptional regulator of viral defense system